MRSLGEMCKSDSSLVGRVAFVMIQLLTSGRFSLSCKALEGREEVVLPQKTDISFATRASVLFACIPLKDKNGARLTNNISSSAVVPLEQESELSTVQAQLRNLLKLDAVGTLQPLFQVIL
jgi:hypothetical protein